MTKAFSAEDLSLHRRITDLHCAHRVPLAAAAVRSVDREGDTYVSCIWAFSPDGSPAKQLTAGPGSDTCPRVSPDGRTLAFLSSRSGTVQVYVLPLDGGE